MRKRSAAANFLGTNRNRKYGGEMEKRRMNYVRTKQSLQLYQLLFFTN